MTHGPSTGPLFRRRRRWPWVLGALLLAIGLGAAVGAVVLDDGRAARTLVQGPLPTPDPTPAESATPDLSEPPDEDPAEPTPTPSLAPTPASAAPTPAGLPSSAPSRSPAPAPSPAPSPAQTYPPGSYPPPGMKLAVSAQHVGANRARIRVRVTDTDGSWNGGYVDFGDGTSREFPHASPSCSGPSPGPYRPAPSDRTVELTHDYPAKGTYDVFVRVRTNRPCHGTPVEEASRVVSVTVDDATPGPTPTPILTPPAVP